MSLKRISEEELNLNSIYPTRENDLEGFKTIKKERRIDIYHGVIHFFAFLILVPYITLIAFQIEIPQSYSTIVSVVIGFYFAKSLFN